MSDNSPVAPLEPPTPTVSDDVARLRRWSVLGVGVCIVAALVFAALQYQIPRGYDSFFWGLNPRAVQHFQGHLRFSWLPPTDPDSWMLRFKGTLGILWGAYALTLFAGWRGGAPSSRQVLAAVIAVSLILAVFCAPLLTTDCYAYVAYARMHLLYGQNPYVTTPTFLFGRHDLVAPFLVWNLPTVYGPVWTGLSFAAVAALPAAWLWGQVVAMKLIAAVALWGAAVAGKRIADHFAPGRGNLALLAIGLNPVLLIEGPGNGHNDLLLVSLILISAACFLQRKYGWAGLVLGLAVGIKLIPLALLPWMLLQIRRDCAPGARLKNVLLLTAGTLLPTILGYLPFWQGPATLAPILQRSFFRADPAALARDLRLSHWLLQHWIPSPLASLLTSLYQHAIILALYGAVSLWLCRTKTPGAWLTGWALLTAGLMFWGMGLPFPWYIAWFWPFCLLRWDRRHVVLSAACFVLSLVWIGRYAMLFPLAWFHS